MKENVIKSTEHMINTIKLNAFSLTTSGAEEFCKAILLF